MCMCFMWQIQRTSEPHSKKASRFHTHDVTPPCHTPNLNMGAETGRCGWCVRFRQHSHHSKHKAAKRKAGDKAAIAYTLPDDRASHGLSIAEDPRRSMPKASPCIGSNLGVSWYCELRKHIADDIWLELSVLLCITSDFVHPLIDCLFIDYRLLPNLGWLIAAKSTRNYNAKTLFYLRGAPTEYTLGRQL